RDVESLIKALGDDEWSRRDMAAQALGDLGDRRAVPALINKLSWGSEPNVIRALSVLQDPRAIDPLLSALQAGSFGSAEREALIGEALASFGGDALNRLIDTV